MSLHLRTPHARRGTALVLTALAAAGAAAELSASVATAKPKPSPTRLTIGQLPASPALGLFPRVDAVGSFVIAVAPTAGLTDETVVTRATGELWFSRLDDRPTKLTVPGVPVWAQPHLGTTADGRAVAVYPRCATDAVASCDLYTWDVDANTERALSEVNGSATGELEGTMQGGTIAWTVAPDGALGSATTGPAPRRTLMHRTAAGGTTTVTARGGKQLALRGAQIAQVVPGADEESARVELVRVAGGNRTTLVRYTFGAAGRWAVGLRFFGTELRFGLASQDAARLYRVPLSRPKAARFAAAAGPFTSGAFASSDQFVWIGESTRPASAPLVTDRVPKPLR